MQPPAGSQVSRVPAQRTPPEQLAPPAPAPAPVRPRRRLRTVLGIVAGVLALLCGTGAVAGFILYDRATAPDRSAPDIVVATYIQAYLVDRDDAKAQEFACQGGSDVGAVRSLRTEVEQREANFNVVVKVSWGPLIRAKDGDGESVTTTLAISSSSNGEPRSSRREVWRFYVVNQDGWRVCGSDKVG